MKLLKLAILTMLFCVSMANADEISKKACESFLPAFGAQNIDLILNGFKREFQDNEKGKKKFDEILKATEDLVSDDAQKRCDAGIYPIMNLDVCYMKCKTKSAEVITGNFAWNVSDRYYNMNLCYQACTGAYVAQNAITRALRKTASEASTCGSTTNVIDSRKSKQIENILLHVDQTTDSANGLGK